MEARQELELPSPRRTARLVWRALTLRCPHCGARGIFRSWFHLREHCPRCGLRLERGEHDYFLGSIMFNLVVAEGLFLLGMVGLIIGTWPDVPWDFLQYGGVLLMLLAPFLLFPLSKTIWMAFDLALRPPRQEEFER